MDAPLLTPVQSQVVVVVEIHPLSRTGLIVTVVVVKGLLFHHRLLFRSNPMQVVLVHVVVLQGELD
jgi:hypothetical protein